MTPADLADLRRIASSQFMLPVMSRETLRELLAAYDAAGERAQNVSPYLRAPLRSFADVMSGRDEAPIVARDLCDMGTTAHEIAGTLHNVGSALTDTYAGGDPSESVCRDGIRYLRDAQHRIAGLIVELEAEAGR